jgi:GNAT superfamily N-acetyltransferase
VATEDDVPSIQRISISTGQPESDSGADAGYVRHILAVGSAVVAEADGHVLGWAAITSPGPGSLLSDLFVDSDAQGRGIGTALLAALWPPAGRQARFTFSSSHPAARATYLRAGLLPRWSLLYLTGPPVPAAEVSAAALRATATEAVAAERALTGADRAADYRYWTTHLGAEPFVVLSDGELVAAGTRTSTRLIHQVCSAGSDPIAAVLASLATQTSGLLQVCLPEPHPAVPVLAARGYRVVEHDTAMATEQVALSVTNAYSPGLA